MTISRIFWEWLFLAIEDTIDNLVLADQAIIRSDQISNLLGELTLSAPLTFSSRMSFSLLIRTLVKKKNAFPKFGSFLLSPQTADSEGKDQRMD